MTRSPVLYSALDFTWGEQAFRARRLHLAANRAQLREDPGGDPSFLPHHPLLKDAALPREGQESRTGSLLSWDTLLPNGFSDKPWIQEDGKQTLKSSHSPSHTHQPHMTSP